MHEGEDNQHTWLLSIKGAPTVTWNETSTILPSGSAIALTGAKTIALASDTAAQLVLLQGAPLREAFIQRGPFAMSTEAEIDAVKAAYDAGALGSID